MKLFYKEIRIQIQADSAKIKSKALRKVYITWMLIGETLGFINTRIILTILFMVVITPISLIYKVLGKDPLKREIDKSVDSYRIKPTHNDPIDHMENPF